MIETSDTTDRKKIREILKNKREKPGEKRFRKRHPKLFHAMIEKTETR
jgi:hypothetical protein